MKIVFASNNRHKLGDMAVFLAHQPITLINAEELILEQRLGRPPAPDEVYDTYFQNARLKADAWRVWSGMPALADDSGLEVFALSGAPGVHSAFFAGSPSVDKNNNEKLLRELQDVADRRALFRCLLCLSVTEGEYLIAEGTVEGNITREPRGNTGWGYEPIFEIPDFGKTIAELRDDGIPIPSHRARAVENLAALVHDIKRGEVSG
jgi:XTP/dITP diphosphohydrolase